MFSYGGFGLGPLSPLPSAQWLLSSEQSKVLSLSMSVLHTLVFRLGFARLSQYGWGVRFTPCVAVGAYRALSPPMCFSVQLQLISRLLSTTKIGNLFPSAGSYWAPVELRRPRKLQVATWGITVLYLSEQATGNEKEISTNIRKPTEPAMLQEAPASRCWRVQTTTALLSKTISGSTKKSTKEI